VRGLVFFSLFLLFACKSSNESFYVVGACEQFGAEAPVDVPESCGIDVAGDGETVWIARSDDGRAWQSLQVDPGNAVADNPRGDAAFVRVAARDDAVFVAFADFREFSWDVYLASSTSWAEAFAPAMRINPAAQEVVPVSGTGPIEAERIHGDVALTLDPTGNPIVAWTERQDRRYESRIVIWRAGETARADDAPETIDAWRPALGTSAAGEVLVVWQDLRDGTNRARLAKTAASSLELGSSILVDDAAVGTHVYAPQIATRAEQTLIAWEDPRSGYARVRLVRSD
jgi:hypothetical protein